MDWNWFYSSVAQSAAALVGIFAAFIITRIISSQIDFSRKKGELQSCQADCEKLVNQLRGRYVDWYNERTREQELGKLLDLIREHNCRDAHFYFRKLNFSLYDDRDQVLSKIAEELARHAVSASKAETPRVNPSGAYNHISQFVYFPSPELKLYNKELIDDIISEREEIDKIVLEIEDQSKRVVLVLGQVEGNPESSVLVNVLLMALLGLFYLGIIYPLSFLPVGGEYQSPLSFSAFWDILFSLKGAILAGISIVFNAVLVLFMVINSRLKYDSDEIERLREFGDPRNYSVYIRNKYDNREYFRIDSRSQENPPCERAQPT